MKRVGEGGGGGVVPAQECVSNLPTRSVRMRLGEYNFPECNTMDIVFTKMPYFIILKLLGKHYASTLF